MSAAAPTRWIALLRGVNLGPNRRLRMADLRAALHAAGFGDAATLLQSGNVVFSADASDRDGLATRLERVTSERCGLATRYVLRTAAEWRRTLAANPFPDESERDPSHLVVLAGTAKPTRAGVAALLADHRGDEIVRLAGGEVWVYFGAHMADSKLTAAKIDRHLGGVFTARNWNTARKLAALAERPSGAP